MDVKRSSAAKEFRKTRGDLRRARGEAASVESAASFEDRGNSNRYNKSVAHIERGIAQTETAIKNLEVGGNARMLNRMKQNNSQRREMGRGEKAGFTRRAEHINEKYEKQRHDARSGVQKAQSNHNQIKDSVRSKMGLAGQIRDLPSVRRRGTRSAGGRVGNYNVGASSDVANQKEYERSNKKANRESAAYFDPAVVSARKAEREAGSGLGTQEQGN